MTEAKPPTICPKCKAKINHIPAGVSKKTGKKYSEFWSCANRCGYVWRKPTQKSSMLEEMKAIREDIKSLKQSLQDFIDMFINKQS
jgi:predicted amidophosphoribosyltransferase